MKYVGMHTQQVQNNLKSVLLLLLFPCILLGVVYVFLVICNSLGVKDPMYGGDTKVNWDYVNYEMLQVLPWVVGIVGVWFLIYYLFNTSMIRHATGARPLERKENPRVYNIVENLTMACGMPMPKVNVIDDPMLNAFASGIEKTEAYRPDRQFSDAVKVLHTYGAKVVRPKEMALLKVHQGS